MDCPHEWGFHFPIGLGIDRSPSGDEFAEGYRKRKLTMTHSEKFACPACGGMGWTRHRTDTRPGNDASRPHDYAYPDCRECRGSGERTKDQVEAYHDRYRG